MSSLVAALTLVGFVVASVALLLLLVATAVVGRTTVIVSRRQALKEREYARKVVRLNGSR